ncbi:MAG: hypothetical protein RIB58_11635 [Phycisphaerales bacterium]
MSERHPPPPPVPPQGPRPTPREAAIAGILGLDPNADAAGLIGVDAANTDDGEIVEALNQKLAMVNAHRYGGTPLGDEARLALHAAAAQLLGGRRRSWDGDSSAQADLPARWSRTSALPPAQQALQQDAVMALGAHGGWNATTMRHLSMLAHARGLTADDLAVALTRLARQSGPALPSVQATSNGRGAGDDQRTDDSGRFEPEQVRARSSGDMALLGAMAVAVILTLVAAAAVLIAIPVMRSGGLNAQRAAEQEQASATGAEQPAAETDPQPATGDTSSDRVAELSTDRAAVPDTRLDTILTDLRLAAERRRADDPTAQRVLERAVIALADNWPRMPADRRLAALGLVIDHLYLVRSDPAATRRVVDFLIGPMSADSSPTLAARVFQVALVVRLAQEPDLPGAVVEAMRVFLLNEAPVEARAAGDFSSGLAVALRDELAKLSDSDGFVAEPDAWQAWLACAQGLSASEPTLAQRLILAALEAVLLRGPEPTDERVFQIVRRLVVALPWRAEDESRGRVLAWFDDPAVTVADLHAVTNVLATASSAAGVDATMVLPVLASQAQRVQVRDRFAASWNVQSVIAHDVVTNRWLSEARRHLDELLPQQQTQAAFDAAISARLNAAGALLWQGRANEADTVMLTLRDGLNTTANRAAAGTRSIYMASHSDPSPWALEYLQERRPELQIDLLDELAQRGPTHAVEAELVALAFLRGSTIGIRQRAGNILLGHARRPVVIAAVLETLPLPGADPRRRELVEMVTGVRLPRGDNWELVARRELVERLLELLAAEGELAQIDRAAAAIGNAYSTALVASPEASSEDTLPTELAAELLWTNARARADRLVPPTVWPWTPAEVDRRLAGRTRLAGGRVQWFAAYQAALAEIELYNAAADRPSLALRLADELESMQDDRRTARSVLEQIAITERTRLRVWLLVLSDATAGGPQ